MSSFAQPAPLPSELAVVIVNWNSVAWLRRCLTALFARTRLRLETVVADNASFDGCAAVLAFEFPQVRFQQNLRNLGFAAANNAAARLTSAPTLLFLNPDTEPDPAALDALYRVLWAWPQTGAVGPRLLNSDRTLQTSCVQSFPTILNQMLDSNWLRARFPRAALWGMQPLFACSREPARVDLVSGACLMVKRAAFDEVGGFCTDYFMYADDVALCHDLWHLSWSVLHVPDAMVVHHGGASVAVAPSNFSATMRRRSVHQFLSRTRGPAYAAVFRLAIATSAAIRIAALSLGRLFPAGRPRRAQSSRAWSAVLRWSLGC